ncbi:acyl-CoA thioesterase [Rhodococcus sp. IEGM1428]|uniref:acyl-CoA thioesterase n=1 Tax=Rhodococcus sp. IEGM1428 TaxID=3392191 RepID=UPI003D10A463
MYVERRDATTRWSDNDMYGHLNNAVYYQLFDAAINGWLIERTGVDPSTSQELAVVVESGCRFHHQLAFPDRLQVGLRVVRLGRTSVTYELGLFSASASESTSVAAVGTWVHVYVDRATRRPTDIPKDTRALFESAFG